MSASIMLSSRAVREARGLARWALGGGVMSAESSIDWLAALGRLGPPRISGASAASST